MGLFHRKAEEADEVKSQAMALDVVKKGTVTNWTSKGYGFIEPDDGSQDLFVHYSNVYSDVAHNSDRGKPLKPGDRVEFSVEENRNRPGLFKAVGVRLIE